MQEQATSLFDDEPVREVESAGVTYTLLGTAHVSRTSAETVRRLIKSDCYDAVAVELCQSRYQALTDRKAWSHLDLFTVIREGKAGRMMAGLALSAYQRRIAEQFGIEPGAEMKAAIEGARDSGLPLQLVDREIGITLRRTSCRLSLWRRWLLTNGLIASLFTREKIGEEEIERLKQGDILTETFSEFASHAPELYEPLINERDRFMAARLKQENTGHPGRRVLAVVGAGHLEGTSRALTAEENPDTTTEALNEMPPPSRMLKLIPWLIVGAVLTGFGIGFARSPELGWSLVVTWLVINGTLSALGAAMARAHPVTILGALLAAPLTSLNPTIGAGMVAGAIETWFRKPRIEDFETLRDDVARLAGWWNNRVARVFLVFFLASMGSVAGTWLAGFRMVQQLL